NSPRDLNHVLEETCAASSSLTSVGSASLLSYSPISVDKKNKSALEENIFLSSSTKSFTCLAYLPSILKSLIIYLPPLNILSLYSLLLLQVHLKYILYLTSVLGIFSHYHYIDYHLLIVLFVLQCLLI